MCYSLSIACAESCEKLYKFLIFFLDLAQSDELFDDLWCYLVLQQFEIIAEKLFDGALRIYIILFVGLHCLWEKEVDPLGRIHLIDFVTADWTFQKFVGYLAYAC